jgi:hypothetical protein
LKNALNFIYASEKLKEFKHTGVVVYRIVGLWTVNDVHGGVVQLNKAGGHDRGESTRL